MKNNLNNFILRLCINIEMFGIGVYFYQDKHLQICIIYYVTFNVKDILRSI